MGIYKKFSTKMRSFIISSGDSKKFPGMTYLSVYPRLSRAGGYKPSLTDTQRGFDGWNH